MHIVMHFSFNFHVKLYANENIFVSKEDIIYIAPYDEDITPFDPSLH